MRGNLHVQFSGGWARATAPGYPATLESHARDDRLQTWVAWNGLQPLLTAVELRRNMQHKMRLYGGELSRSPPYASILPLRSVKGPLRQASPALDPTTACPGKR